MIGIDGEPDTTRLGVDTDTFLLVSDRGLEKWWVADLPLWRQECPTFNERLDCIDSMLGDCYANHSNCKAKQGKNPTRLIYVGSKEQRDENSLRLVLGEDIPGRVFYFTLSHCWGSQIAKPLCTTRASETDFRHEIRFQDLPANYRDAVIVTRLMGVCYLWIDSLCIIQDDPSDWAAEAAKMAQYYENSYLTIAAAVSSDSHRGFIRRLEPSNPPSLTIAYAPRPNRKGQESPLARYALRRQVVIDDALRAGGAPLLGRGWVLQEQVLSVRTAYFTGGQILFHCRTGFYSEDYALKPGSSQNKWSIIPRSAYRFDPKVDASKSWWQWISDYSTRELTFAKDRVPAVAGLVAHYATVTGHTPLLGLWKESLWLDLSWRTRLKRDDAEREVWIRRPEFPSWSWLSIMSETSKYVHPPEAILPQMQATALQVIRADVAWEDENTTLAYKPKSTHLVLSGLVKPAAFQLMGHYHETQQLLLAVDGGDPTLCHGFLDEFAPWKGSSIWEVYILHLYQAAESNSMDLDIRGSIEWWMVRDHCLILHREQGGQKYRRIGLVELEYEQDLITRKFGKRSRESWTWTLVEKKFSESDRTVVELI